MNPEPEDLEPRSIKDRWAEAEEWPLDVTVEPEPTPVAGWMDDPDSDEDDAQ